MSDPTPPGERRGSSPQTVSVTGVSGEHTHVDTAYTTGIDNSTTIHQVQDTEAPLKLNIKAIEETLKTRKENFHDTEAKIQKLQDDINQQQKSATTEGTANLQKQICQLKEECKTHESEIERLETEVLPDLKARRHQVQKQLEKHEETTKD